MIPLEEALAHVLGACRRLPPRPVAIDDSLGCVVAGPVAATEAVPPFDNSAMDGYAVRADDTSGDGADLRVVGAVMAGSTFDGTVGPGEAVRIMTGAPLPAGADAVCMLEETSGEPGGGVVHVPRQLVAGDYVRRAAEDVAPGDEILGAGTVVSPGHIGVLADQGIADVLAVPPPRVGVLSTGDELSAGPGRLGPGQIRDANRHTLLAMVRREGWTAVDLGIVGDDEEALRRVLSDVPSACDAVVSSGGVSVGDLDVVKVVLSQLSDESMRWMQVAIKPAKPLAFGTLSASGVPVFGLPGNPVSAMVSFELFVRPALRLVAGHRVLGRPRVSATADTELRRRPDGKTHFLRGRVSLDRHMVWHVSAMPGQGSHQLRGMADANALVVLPDGEGMPAGHAVEVLLTDPGRLDEG